MAFLCHSDKNTCIVLWLEDFSFKGLSLISYVITKNLNNNNNYLHTGILWGNILLGNLSVSQATTCWRNFLVVASFCCQFSEQNFFINRCIVSWSATEQKLWLLLLLLLLFTFNWYVWLYKGVIARGSWRFSGVGHL